MGIFPLLACFQIQEMKNCQRMFKWQNFSNNQWHRFFIHAFANCNFLPFYQLLPVQKNLILQTNNKQNNKKVSSLLPQLFYFSFYVLRQAFVQGTYYKKNFCSLTTLRCLIKGYTRAYLILEILTPYPLFQGLPAY